MRLPPLSEKVKMPLLEPMAQFWAETVFPDGVDASGPVGPVLPERIVLWSVTGLWVPVAKMPPPLPLDPAAFSVIVQFWTVSVFEPVAFVASEMAPPVPVLDVTLLPESVLFWSSQVPVLAA